MIDDNVFINLSENEDTDFLATVYQVYDDGISLEINGEPTSKHYKSNADCIFTSGDIVKVKKISGTYIVEYRIGTGGQTEPSQEYATKQYVDEQISGALEGSY